MVVLGTDVREPPVQIWNRCSSIAGPDPPAARSLLRVDSPGGVPSSAGDVDPGGPRRLGRVHAVLYNWLVKCPSCSKLLRKAEVQEVLSMSTETRNWRPSWMSCYNIWACPDCLRAGRALRADPSKQDHGGLGSPPFLAYWDRSMQCEYCGEAWTFTKEEQQFWYDTCGFHVQSYPTGCSLCRRQVRARKDAQKELMKLLAQLDPNDPEQLARAGELSLLNGNVNRALQFLRRAKNMSSEPQALIQRIEQIQREGSPPVPMRSSRAGRKILNDSPAKRSP